MVTPVVSVAGCDVVVGAGADVVGLTPCAPTHAVSQTVAVRAIVGMRARRSAENVMGWISGDRESGIRDSHSEIVVSDPVANHRGELVGIQGRSSDQRSVDLALGHECSDVPGVDRPSVEDPDGFRRALAV